MMMRLWLLVCRTVSAVPVQAADLSFCWVGANGYNMIGALSLPDAFLYKAIVPEADLMRFKISG